MSNKEIMVKKKIKGKLLQSSIQFLKPGDLFTLYSHGNRLRCNGSLLLATSNPYKNNNGDLSINYVKGE